MATSLPEEGVIVPGYLRDLMNEKEIIENKIAHVGATLKQNNVGMTEPLVDANDFPRADIAVHEVRHARAMLISLQNDYKDILNRIEQALINFHAGATSMNFHAGATSMNFHAGATSSPGGLTSYSVRDGNKNYKNLAKITNIAPGSPADYAGLQNNDVLLELGSVNGNNYTGFEDIAAVVHESMNLYMKVVVRRGDRIIRLNLKPKKWSGNGTLGCMIVPV